MLPPPKSPLQRLTFDELLSMPCDELDRLAAEDRRAHRRWLRATRTERLAERDRQRRYARAAREIQELRNIMGL